jgi:hypothetical protein
MPKYLEKLKKFKGGWDAKNNQPDIKSGEGEVGNYYYVSYKGNTNLDSIKEWNLNDIIYFDEKSTTWKKIDKLEKVMVNRFSTNLLLRSEQLDMVRDLIKLMVTDALKSIFQDSSYEVMKFDLILIFMETEPKGIIELSNISTDDFAMTINSAIKGSITKEGEIIKEKDKEISNGIRKLKIMKNPTLGQRILQLFGKSPDEVLADLEKITIVDEKPIESRIIDFPDGKTEKINTNIYRFLTSGFIIEFNDYIKEEAIKMALSKALKNINLGG